MVLFRALCCIVGIAQEALLKQELNLLQEDNKSLQSKYDETVVRAENAEQAADHHEQARSIVAGISLQRSAPTSITRKGILF